MPRETIVIDIQNSNPPMHLPPSLLMSKRKGMRTQVHTHMRVGNKKGVLRKMSGPWNRRTLRMGGKESQDIGRTRHHPEIHRRRRKSRKTYWFRLDSLDVSFCDSWRGGGGGMGMRTTWDTGSMVDGVGGGQAGRGRHGGHNVTPSVK